MSYSFQGGATQRLTISEINLIYFNDVINAQLVPFLTGHHEVDVKSGGTKWQVLIIHKASILRCVVVSVSL